MPPCNLLERSNSDCVKTNYLTMPPGFRIKKRSPVWHTIFPLFGTHRHGNAAKAAHHSDSD